MVVKSNGSAALSAAFFQTQPIQYVSHSDEIKGQFTKTRRLNVRTLSEIWEVAYETDHERKELVAVKYLRFVNVLRQSTSTSIAEKTDQSEKARAVITSWLGMDHENIRPLMGYRWGEDPFIVFKWSQHGNITTYCQDKSFSEKCDLLSQAADGLAFLHSRVPEMVHGALNPSNIIISDKRKAMLCDFGLGSFVLLAGEGMTTSDTEKNAIAPYTSPDLLETGDFTKESDIYAFGTTIVEVLSGKRPFHGKRHPHVVTAILTGKTASREDHPELPVDSPYWEIAYKCWSFEPSMRPSANELKAMLSNETEDTDSNSTSLLGVICNAFYGLFGFL